MGNGYFWGLLLLLGFVGFLGFAYGFYSASKRIATALHDHLSPSEWKSVERALERAGESPHPVR